MMRHGQGAKSRSAHERSAEFDACPISRPAARKGAALIGHRVDIVIIKRNRKFAGRTYLSEDALLGLHYRGKCMSTRSIHINGTTNRESELSIDSSTSAPQGYEKGDFDGHAVQVTITDGRLTIQPGSGAVNAKICYVEIGAQGTTIDQATKDRLAALIEQATTQTAATVQSTTAKRQYVFGSYVDELLSYTNNGTRYFTHSNHLYSPSAVTNSAGQVQERYRYDAYGKQTITTATGTVRNQSAIGFSRGFTGYILDEETKLYYARMRMYSGALGRYINQDPMAFIDGYNLYKASHLVNKLDPYGLFDPPLGMTLTGAEGPFSAIWSGMHTVICLALSAAADSQLTTDKERRAWSRFREGTGSEIRLTTDETESILFSSATFNADLDALKVDCQDPPTWEGRVTTGGGMAGAPWVKAIAGFSYNIKSSCWCGCLRWTALINDLYDFDPRNPFTTHRGPSGEAATWAVRAAQLGVNCGWKEFYHRGNTSGRAGRCYD